MGAENLQVDFWNGTAWLVILTSVTSGWNNISISSYLISSTFTIRFKGATEVSDTVQDSWNIDVALIQLSNAEYTTEVEFSGSSNIQNWNSLNWTLTSAWTISSVNVTIQLYNFALGGYPTTGDGYAAYTSNATPNTNENKKQTIDTNPNDFRNATRNWKIKVKGVKASSEQFDFKADMIEYNVVKLGGTLFTLKNKSSQTTHIVSIWVNNATYHQRYETNIFINSANTESYSYENITLPNKPYEVKVTTDRGNTAVLASD